MAGERAGHTLQTSALVNEAYLRLIDIRQVRWQNRTQFFAIAARTVRRILVDSARARGNQRRGRDVVKRSLDDAVVVAPDRRAPAAVRTLLQRCLAKDAAQRLRDIGDARFDLDAVNSTPPPIVTRSRRRGLAIAMGTIADALFAGGLTLGGRLARVASSRE
jgi:ECF sigma factor